VAPTIKRLYRAAERYPPADREYRTPESKGRQLPPDAPEEMRRSWDALSAWDTIEAAMAVALGSVSARYVVGFDIPDDGRVTYEPSGEPGHFDLRGDMEELKRYLSDVKVDIVRRSQR
jgi:hypothetical protein